jgi:hypothetical protein
LESLLWQEMQRAKRTGRTDFSNAAVWAGDGTFVGGAPIVAPIQMLAKPLSVAAARQKSRRWNMA